jgi:hypothetical protein
MATPLKKREDAEAKDQAGRNQERRRRAGCRRRDDWPVAVAGVWSRTRLGLAHF